MSALHTNSLSCLCLVFYSRHGCEILIQLPEPFSAFTTSLTISALDSATFVSRTVMSCRIVVKSGLRSRRDDMIRTDDIMSLKVFDRCIEIVIRLLPGHVGWLRVELRVHLWNSDLFLNHLDRSVPLKYVHHSSLCTAVEILAQSSGKCAALVLAPDR